MKYSVFAGAGIALGLFLYICGLFYYQAFTPIAERGSQAAIVEIPPGASLTSVSRLLFEKNLIRSPSAFRLLAYAQRKQKNIQIGEFELNAGMKPGEILEKITSGQAILHRVTIPEGYRIIEINKILSDEGLAGGEAFIEQVSNPEHLASLGITSGSLEGYLFPDTYHFTRNTSAQVIVETMLNNFKKKIFTEEYLERASEIGYSLHEIITLASVIEKETGAKEERKLISSVFHNRLNKKMRLQTDPTVIYAIKDFDGNLRKKDLYIDSPYNTYRYRGLPPGPIASPGQLAIEAALYPAQTDHLYFVSKQDGTHQFSNNLKEHNRAVHKYQLRPIKRTP
ncbi:MAG: endolytic transglycosylase MltG [Candidatus Nitrohelix vancouverensis]|uniref:Endolytic murein transglycosylase n=1 Tax=Candidatus Nitrohelix vancouverensis TaxID=2705534 RepID=A0A7T0C390_9BACT|nr:MAG: endolytic transglycosylase MltG [Candidatus Nitrohelix vancouverensis]